MLDDERMAGSVNVMMKMLLHSDSPSVNGTFRSWVMLASHGKRQYPLSIILILHSDLKPLNSEDNILEKQLH